MKNRIYIFSVALLAMFALTSCEDFLDKGPEENLVVDDIFANRDYTRDFLTHTYSWIPTEANMADSGGAWRNPYTAGCDEMECAYGGAYGHQINNGGWNPTNIQETQIWAESYMALRKVNMMLEKVDNCPTTEEELRHWKGECHFLRAFFHFLAFRAFGAIPIADRCFDVNENLVAIRRSPVDAVVKFMVDECDKAAELLYDEDRWPANETGRATRLSALALKSRILLYWASPLYNGNTDFAAMVDPVDGTPLISQTYDADRWRLAAEAAKACMDACAANGRQLYNKYPDDPVKNYREIFNECWNDEVLWAKNIVLYDHWLNCADPISFGCYSILDPTQEMVDAYEMADGSTPILGYTNNGMVPVINKESGYTEEGFVAEAHPKGYWPAGVSNMYVNREPRFYASISFAGSIWKTNAPNYNPNDPHTLEFWFYGCDGKNNAGSDYCKTGYLMRKLVNENRIPWRSTPLQQWIYIRLGEIYLNYAEALNEQSGPVDEVYSAVDAIRERAGLPGLPKGLSKDEMREKIRHERRIELAFEVHRFFDVRRWKIAPETQGIPIHSMDIYAGENLQDTRFYNRIKVEDRVFESPKHYFLPIYQVEIEKHQDGSLVQNLGWTAEKTVQ